MLNEKGDATDQSRCGRPSTAKTPKKVRAVAEKISWCPKTQDKKNCLRFKKEIFIHSN